MTATLLRKRSPEQFLAAATKFPPPAEQATGDHLGRTDKDFAIEFGEYLARAAEHYVAVENAADNDAVNDAVNDAGRALTSAIYEFRKRAGTLK